MLVLRRSLCCKPTCENHRFPHFQRGPQNGCGGEPPWRPRHASKLVRLQAADRQTDRLTKRPGTKTGKTGENKQRNNKKKGEGEEKLLASKTMTFLRELLQYPRL